MLKRQSISEQNLKNVLYFQKCEILNENLVFGACYFQYSVEVFFTDILMDSDLLGEIKFHAIRVELQFRCSPHIHFFLWILNWVKLSKKTIKEYVAFLDQAIYSVLLDETVDKDLHELVKLYPTHQHSQIISRI